MAALPALPAAPAAPAVHTFEWYIEASPFSSGMHWLTH